MVRVKKFMSLWWGRLVLLLHNLFRPIQLVDLPVTLEADQETNRHASPTITTGERSRGSLAEILESVEDAFAALNCIDEWSSVDRDTRRGMRKLGPWVPFGRLLGLRGEAYRTQVDVKYLKNRPSMIFIATDHLQGIPQDGFTKGEVFVFNGKERTIAEDIGVFTFGFAMKYSKPPWYVNVPTRGDLYNFGAAFRRKGKLQWVSACVVLGPDGLVTPCQELHQTRIDIKNVGSYFRKEWLVGDYIRYGNEHKPPDSYLDVFVRVFEWWQRRDERWTVSVRKGRDRVTWSVDQAQTKVFFKDRDKTALTPSGQMKRIIHHVVEHTRQLADGRVVTVKEHIRGLRTFTWRGFSCAIVAPKFHVWSATKFDVGATDVSDITDNAAYTVEQIGAILSKLEDHQEPHYMEPAPIDRRKLSVVSKTDE